MRIFGFISSASGGLHPQNKRSILTTTQFPNCLHYNFCVKKWSKVCQKLYIFVKKRYKSGQKLRIFRLFSTFFYGSTISRMRFCPNKHRLPPPIRQELPPNSRCSYFQFTTPFYCFMPSRHFPQLYVLHFDFLYSSSPAQHLPGPEFGMRLPFGSVSRVSDDLFGLAC